MGSVRKIFFPTKFEELSFLVVQQLLSLKKSGLEEIEFLYVIDRDDVSFDRYRGFDEEQADKLRHEAETRFEDWLKQLKDDGIRGSYKVEVGDPAAEILAGIRASGADLVVAGRQREKAIERVYLGGTSMTIVRHSQVPVLICKPRADDLNADDRAVNPFERVLFATDFSDVSEAAGEFTAKLGATGTECHLAHVLNERDTGGKDDAGFAEVSARADAQLADRKAALESSFAAVETHLCAGKTVAEILRLRTECDATIIVMGTTGRHGLKELWLGSASHRCVEMSDVPVLLVPSPA
jgi:nucleotide-binding universal stress UspA family protein